MIGVDNFEKIKERFTALWNGEIVDRCCISAYYTPAQIAQEYAQAPEGMDPKYFMTNEEMFLKRHLRLFENTYYAGDAFPLAILNMGAAGHTGFIKGVDVDYSEGTFWFGPTMEEELDVEKIIFDEAGYSYQQTFRAAKYLCEESRGRYLVSMPDNSGNLDVLSFLRTPMELMVDLLTEEHEVKKCLDRIQEIWARTTREIYEVLKGYSYGGSCIGWLNTWAPGFHGQMQSDVSVMISNADFEKYVRGELEAQADVLEYPLYHFDGQEQIRHLDTLLSIEKLKMIQWTPVEDQPSPLKFLPELKRIQDSGKGLLLMLKAEEVEPVLTNLSSKGLFIRVAARSREEADEVVKLAEKLTHE